MPQFSDVLSGELLTNLFGLRCIGHMGCAEIYEVLVQGLENRRVKKPGLRSEIGKDERLSDAGLSRNCSGRCASIAAAFELIACGTKNTIDDILG